VIEASGVGRPFPQERDRLADLAPCLGQLVGDALVEGVDPRFRARDRLLRGPDGGGIRVKELGAAALEVVHAVARGGQGVVRRAVSGVADPVADRREIADDRRAAFDEGGELQFEAPRTPVALLMSSERGLELAQLHVELRESILQRWLVSGGRGTPHTTAIIRKSEG
jgi:hypothetical protein